MDLPRGRYTGYGKRLEETHQRGFLVVCFEAGDQLTTLLELMGSLVKKRRKRMRKKKHKKMLRRTRYQRKNK
jgi:hypothetical protein